MLCSTAGPAQGGTCSCGPTGSVSKGLLLTSGCAATSTVEPNSRRDWRLAGTGVLLTCALICVSWSAGPELSADQAACSNAFLSAIQLAVSLQITRGGERQMQACLHLVTTGLLCDADASLLPGCSVLRAHTWTACRCSGVDGAKGLPVASCPVARAVGLSSSRDTCLTGPGTDAICSTDTGLCGTAS